MTTLDHHTDAAGQDIERLAGIVADRILQARQDKAQATALVAAIVARRDEGTNDWLRLAETAGRGWSTSTWEQLADSARTTVPTWAVRDQALAMLAQVGTEGALTADDMWGLHTTRRLGFDTAAAIIASRIQHGRQDWVHLADWLDANWEARDWANLAKVHGLRFEITPAIATAATGFIRTIGLHGQPDAGELAQHDTDRRTRQRLASVPDPAPVALTSCEACDLIVPTVDADESGHREDDRWFCDTCGFHPGEQHRIPSPATSAP